MPVLPLNLDRIREARTALAQQRAVQRAAGADHQRAKAELERMRRAGADPRELEQASARVRALAERARSAATDARTSLKTIAELSERLRDRRDPGVLVQALSARHPVALLPIAVQTRYDKQTTKLMIRIYPDTLHGFTHDPGLTPSEVEEGKQYWIQRFAVPADSTSPWTHIARVLGPSRAAYVVRTTTPGNVGAIGEADAPEFDEASIPLAASDAQPVYAEALPDRFVAIGFRGGREIFRKWGAVVADQLPLSPHFDPLG